MITSGSLSARRAGLVTKSDPRGVSHSSPNEFDRTSFMAPTWALPTVASSTLPGRRTNSPVFYSSLGKRRCGVLTALSIRTSIVRAPHLGVAQSNDAASLAGGGGVGGEYVSCTELTKGTSEKHGKSSEAFGRALPKSSVENFQSLPRLCGRSRRPPNLQRLPTPVNGQRRDGSQASTSRLFLSSSRLCGRRSDNSVGERDELDTQRD